MARKDPQCMFSGLSLAQGVLAGLYDAFQEIGEDPAENLHFLTTPEARKSLLLAAINIRAHRRNLNAIISMGDDRWLTVLEIPNPQLSILGRHGVRTVGDLRDKTEDEILQLPGMDQELVNEIKAALTKHGLSLRWA